MFWSSFNLTSKYAPQEEERKEGDQKPTKESKKFETLIQNSIGFCVNL